MTEGLKNVGPTFYRMMKAILRDQMQRNFFTDVDDIIVSSKKKETQIHDLAETFANMRGAQLKLNLEKMCIRCAKEQSIGQLSIFERNQTQPRQDQCHSVHEASAV
jgi:predicted transcriptional regulator